VWSFDRHIGTRHESPSPDHTLAEFLHQFPTVTREMAIQALEEAKDSLLARIA